MSFLCFRESAAFSTVAVDGGAVGGIDVRAGIIVVIGEGQDVETEGKVDVSEEGVTEKGNSDSMNRT